MRGNLNTHFYFWVVIDESTVLENHGIKTILRIMKKYPDQESLQTTSLFALGSIVMKSGKSIVFSFLILEKNRLTNKNFF